MIAIQKNDNILSLFANDFDICRLTSLSFWTEIALPHLLFHYFLFYFILFYYFINLFWDNVIALRLLFQIDHFCF
jgi:hypothetical protein